MEGLNIALEEEAQQERLVGPQSDGNHAHARNTHVQHVVQMEQHKTVEEDREPIGNNCTTLICAPQGCDTLGMTASEAVAYGKLKTFCSNIIKRLAPPLLKEVQASQLRPEAEPFTPKRTTRASKKTTSTKRARDAPVENVLLQALGMVPDNLEVDEGVVHELRELFDSPLRE